MLPAGVPTPPFLIIFILSAVAGLITGLQTTQVLRDLAAQWPPAQQAAPQLTTWTTAIAGLIAGLLAALLTAATAITVSIATAYRLNHRRTAGPTNQPKGRGAALAGPGAAPSPDRQHANQEDTDGPDHQHPHRRHIPLRTRSRRLRRTHRPRRLSNHHHRR